MKENLKENKQRTKIPYYIKIGSISNAMLLYLTFYLNLDAPSYSLTPARIFLFVNMFRCTFPNHFHNKIVLHDTLLSSIWITRFLATFSEVIFMYTLSALARDLNLIRDGGPLILID